MTQILNLIWLDLEMTGLEPEKDRILEIATIVTDPDLNVIAEGPVIAIHQAETILNAMNTWCQETHTKNGLITRVKASAFNEQKAQRETLKFLAQFTKTGLSPMCGNTIGQDRRFLHKYMPELHNYFHYRNLDVSSLKELAKRWKPSILKALKKSDAHTALQDVKDSIEELRHYRKYFINLNEN